MSHTTVRRTCALYFFAAARYNLAKSPVWYDARRNMQKQAKIATQRLPIDEWVKGLAAMPDREFTLEAVQDYILQHAVSIHVYSKPFDTCEIYQREKGTYSDVPLHYTSEYGKLNPAEKLL